MSELSRPGLSIVGASARAAAMSAIRSGFEPWAADRFCDCDLRACAPTIQMDDYPAGLERALSAAPPGPWLYTGALENRPALIERLARTRRLYGVSGESLRAVRDPFRLAAALAKAGLTAPRCERSGARLPRDGSWLRKPLASAGGCGVHAWEVGSLAENSPHGTDIYFQQRIDGLPVGAMYVAAQRTAELLGVTRQLIGLDWCGLSARVGHRFRYCGSIGPLRLAPAVASRFEQLGNALADAFDLRGLFGVDAIVAYGEIWPVEVNPRYTASVEILERALGVRSVALHSAACGGDIPSLPPSVQPENDRPACCGKAILFAARATAVAPEFGNWCNRQNQGKIWPALADIPAGGTSVRAGQPMATVLADGPDEAAVLIELKSLASLAVAEIAGHELGRPA
jgi:uncharacterized protein